MSKLAFVFSFFIAAQAIAQDGAIDRMVQRLSDNDPEIRKQAVKDLTKVGKDAVPALERLLKDGDLDSQIQAKSVLNKIEWDLGIDSIKKYMGERSSNKDVQIEMIGTRTLATWLPNVRLIQTIVKIPGAKVEDGEPAMDRNVFAVERYGNTFSKIFVGGIYSPSSLVSVLKGYKVLGREQAMDLAGILSEISTVVTGEKQATSRLENKGGTWTIIGQDGETIAFKVDEQGSLADIQVSTIADAGETTEKERLEIEKLKLEIEALKFQVEANRKAPVEKKKAVDDLVILFTMEGGIAGLHENTSIVNGEFFPPKGTHGFRINPISNEDQAELRKLARALIDSNPPDKYSTGQGADFIIYTIHVRIGNEACNVKYRDDVKTSPELQALSKKYLEIKGRGNK